ncbi:RHS repeat-associated core domain-containing protein [Flavobacterium sp.]|uniref:RHS repeat-associated core domain-containing protein n=1 Tax=Flavobacterium sp. TaxID=239 RepID=UPI0026343A07|nr:RHS repeat-associated core domain-containing protein [Flavobacterium sp.]
MKGTYVSPSTRLITFNGLTESTNTNLITNGEDELEISWNRDTTNPAVEYELEWTWIDNYGDNNNVLNASQIALTEQAFRLSSTRIQTKDLSYRIPLIFSKGYLIYRVRPVGRFLDNVQKNYYGLWSSGVADAFTTVDNWPHKILINTNHEGGTKNWQYQSSFAEDGKKKEVVSYFDGSLRNRQTVTKINSNNQAVVGEVIYDNQGRAAIEVLPVPIEHRAIKYFGALNQNATTAYSHFDFDWDQPNNACVPSFAAEMSTNSGASKYYSGMSLVTNTFQDFVPDAQKYPFSQIVYTPDNTGRISKKSGVGKDHQIGQGHEMTYLYEQPAQEELNRLFGYKVGNFNKYKKNTVVDPNGQVSVSYLDPQGRTVATALSGNKEGNLVPLDDATADFNRLTTNLLGNNDKYSTGRFGVLEDGIHLNTTFKTVKDNSLIEFYYNLSHTTNTFTSNCILSTKSYPFVYDLSMSLKDECALEHLPLNLTQSQIGIMSLTNPPGNNPAVVFPTPNFNTTLATKGTYAVGKDIRVNEAAVEAYADDYIATIKNDHSNVCYPNVSQYQVQIDIHDCEVTCVTCEQSLVKNYLTPAEYDLFNGYFLTDDLSALGNTAGRETYIQIAKKNFVLDKLNRHYFPTTFTYAGNVVTYVDPNLEYATIAQNETTYKHEFDLSLETCRDLCLQPVSTCGVNESILLADVSPKGQYGSIEGIVFDNPNTDTASTPNEDDPDVEDPIDTSPIQVLVEDLSVFNEYNKLLKKGAFETAGIDANGDNTTVLFPQSKSSWKYPYTIYMDPDGITESRIKITKIADNLYSPAIEPNTPSNQIYTTSEEDVFEVKPQYLNNVADFITEWKTSWANSLLPYHPEYNYLEYYKALCSASFANKNTDEFDANLNKYDTYAGLPAGLLSSLQDVTTTQDPFYNITYSVENAALATIRKDIMKEALSTNFDGLKYADPVTPTTFVPLNMFKSAVYTVLFGNGFAPSSIYHPVLTGTYSNLITYIQSSAVTDSQRNRIWLTFRNNYISLKAKTKTVFSNIYALKNASYNGYIGDVLDGENYKFLFKKYNAALVFTPITSQFTTNTSPDSTVSPAVAATGCFAIHSESTRLYYLDYTKRFVSADYSYNSGVDDQQSIDDAEHDANEGIYLETGKCPLLLDIEHFLNGFVRKEAASPFKVMYNPNVVTSPALPGLPSTELSSLPLPGQNPIPANAISPLSQDLYNNLGGTTPIENLTSIPNITGVLTNGDQTLEIHVGDLADPISLKIVTPTSYYPSCVVGDPAPTWANYTSLFYIKEFKEIFYVPGGTPGNYKFKVIAVTTNKGTTAAPCYEEILIEGTTSAPLGDCKFVTNGAGGADASTEAGSGCEKRSKFEKNLQQLLNKLKLKAPTSVLASTSPIELKDGYNGIEEPATPGFYNYGNSFIAEFLNDTPLAAKYNAITNGFEIKIGGNAVVHAYNLSQNLSSLPANGTGLSNFYRFSGINIDDSNHIKIIYYTNNGQEHVITGDIRGLNDDPLDFNCLCYDRIPVKQAVEANFLNLINHLWVKKDAQDGIPESYNPKEWQSLDPYLIPNESTIDYFSSDYYVADQGHFNGMFFNFDKSCRFELPIVFIEEKGPGGGEETAEMRNVPSHNTIVAPALNMPAYFHSITHYSNFKLLDETSPGSGEWNFSVIAHNSEFEIPQCTNPTPNHPCDPGEPIFSPAGQHVITGIVTCLEGFICQEQIEVQNNLVELLNDVKDKLIANNYVESEVNGFVSYLPNLPLDMPQSTPRKVSNFNASVNLPYHNLTSMNFNFGNNTTCGIELSIPQNIGTYYSFSDLVFDDNTFTTFKVKYTAIFPGRAAVEGNLRPGSVDPCGGHCPTVVIATGKITCLELDSCSQEVEVPCVTCIPPQVQPAPCGPKWHEFMVEMPNLVENYTMPDYLSVNNQFFCGSNYGYISTQYLKYLRDLNVTNVDDALFITIGEFGATKLNYGYEGMDLAIDSYVAYLSDATHPRISWVNYIANIYVKENAICPPAPLVPNLDLTVTNIPSPCDIFNHSITATYTDVFTAQFFDNKRKEFVSEYVKGAINNLKETYTKTGDDKEYQYTLYYYDQAGNLTQTVPPEGVNRMPISADTTPLNVSINDVRTSHPDFDGNTDDQGVIVAPDHKMETQYQYNSLNQLVWQKTPDGGETRFAYDKLGRIIASQNEKQVVGIEYPIPAQLFSYTKYDELGRINEAGEIAITIDESPYQISPEGKLIWLGNKVDKFDDGTFITRQVTHTLYDEPLPGTESYFEDYSHDNSQKRVTGVLYFNEVPYSIDVNNYDNAIFYDYDVHGNVKELVQRNKDSYLVSIGQDVKKVVYNYDLISGNVNKVVYQPNDKDQFIHKYAYDADNRITDVQTSNDGIVWEKDANYQYYQHGPLARVEIGDKKVQGLDYIYTLQGWLKGVNSEQIGVGLDAGKDGDFDGTGNVAQDAMAFALNYYSGDYISRHNATSSIDDNVFSLSKGMGLEESQNLYNGNIKEMVTSLIKDDQTMLNSQFNHYSYDQLNRIHAMKSTAVLQDGSTHNSYSSGYEYDKNGNLKKLKRYAPITDTPTSDSDYQLMDDFEYKYKDGKNQLTKVLDDADDLFPGTTVDIKKNTADPPYDEIDETTHNYRYDQIGQLIRDESEGLSIEWRVDGKVSSVSKDDGTAITFNYDGLGNRISKTKITSGRGSSIYKTTYYQHDAQGNVLAVYEGNIYSGFWFKSPKKGLNGDLSVKNAENLPSKGLNAQVNEPILAAGKPGRPPVQQNTFTLKEHDIYGSSRLGIQDENIDMTRVIFFPTFKQAPESASISRTESVVTTATPATDLKGLKFDNANSQTSWVNTGAKLNLFDNNEAKTDSISIATHLKLDENITEENTISSFHGNHDSDKLFFRSSVLLTVKKIDGLYVPTVKLIKYYRRYWTRSHPKRHKHPQYFENSIIETSYTIKGIPEKEWDLKANVELNTANAYDVTITLNGNVYKPKPTVETRYEPNNGGHNWGDPEMNRPYIFNNTLGKSDMFYYPWYWKSYNALKSEMCDFTYSIDEYKHQFGFDGVNTGASVSSNTADPDEAVNSIPMNVSGVAASYTYCGPQALDSDLDGILDYHPNGTRWDNCRFTFNPNQEDVDQDGWGDVCDNCRLANSEANPNDHDYQADRDGDGVGDSCDNCEYKYNPRVEDTRIPAVLDANDPSKLNGLYQPDADGDGYGDACDNCRTHANGLAQAQIPNVGNQLDTDHDGIGDVCEGEDQGEGSLEVEGAPIAAYRYVGDKNYELSNHLGNVLSVITDRKLYAETFNNKGVSIFTFLPDVISYNDYYPFGMLVPKRHGDATEYRYGFNGKENDNEVMGEGNFQEYGMRMYNPRIGRFFNADPLTYKYPELTPYQFASNRPIQGIDQDGLEFQNADAAYIVARYGVDALTIKTVDDAFGPVQTQLFTLKVMGNMKEFTKLKNELLTAPQNITDNFYADYHIQQQKDPKGLSEGDEIRINPIIVDFDVYVRVLNVDKDDPNKFSMVFATLYGHPEAGYVKFSGSFDSKTGQISFEVYTDTRESYGPSFFGPSRMVQIDQWEDVMGTVREFLGKEKENTTMKEVIKVYEYDEDQPMGRGKLKSESTDVIDE